MCIFSNSAGLQQFDPEGQQMWTGFNCLDMLVMRQETLPAGSTFDISLWTCRSCSEEA